VIIAVPAEVVPGEKRVAVIPGGAERLVRAGHRVLVQRGAGEGSGHSDAAYVAVGAEIVESADELWQRAELLAKVKQPLEPETARFHDGLTYLGYCHAVSRPWLVDALLERRVAAFASEEVALANGDRPLLIPMSEIAGRLAVLVAAHYLAQPAGSAGVMLGTVTGCPSAHVLIIGGGTVGRSAAAAADGLGARVTVIDRDPPAARLRVAQVAPGARVPEAPASPALVWDLLPEVEAIINAVLWNPLTGEHLVTRDGLRRMKPGAVIVDVDCTPAGVIETSRVMTIDQPTFIEEGVIHYCVPNMPAMVPQTSTRAFAEATLPYLEVLAKKGLEGAIEERPELKLGLIARHGLLLDHHVAEAQGRHSA